MRHKRLFIVVAVLALVSLMGATAAFAATSAVRPAQQSATDEIGLVIVSVDPEGPAAAAGVARGDILLSIGGQATNSAADVTKAVAGLTAGDDVEVVVTHGDEERTLTVTTVDNNGRAYLGIQPYYAHGMQANAAPDVDRLAPAAGGALVMEVVADSPAEAAGLQTGDVIVAVDGEALAEDTSLADVIGAMQPSDTVTLEVQRAGEDATLTLDVTLAENPDKAGVAFLGVQYGPSFSTSRETMPFGEDAMPFFHHRGMPMPDTMPGMPNLGENVSGVAVVSVATDSPAAAAGLAEGDVILAVDGKDVATPEEVVALVGDMTPGDVITLSIQAAGANEAADVEVTLGARPDDAARAYLGVSLGAVQSMTPGQGQFQFQLPFDQGDSQSNDGTPPADQVQPQSPLDLLEQLFPGLSSQQNS